MLAVDHAQSRASLGYFLGINIPAVATPTVCVVAVARLKGNIEHHFPAARHTVAPDMLVEIVEAVALLQQRLLSRVGRLSTSCQRHPSGCR
jgi:hypothetical protein